MLAIMITGAAVTQNLQFSFLKAILTMPSAYSWRNGQAKLNWEAGWIPWQTLTLILISSQPSWL